jgi:hypothetical protein
MNYPEIAKDISALIEVRSYRLPTKEEQQEILLLFDMLYPYLLEDFENGNINKKYWIGSLSDSQVRKLIGTTFNYQKKMIELGFYYPINWLNQLKNRKLRYRPSSLTQNELSWKMHFLNLKKKYNNS